MSTTLWVGDKMYVVDEEVRDHIDKLEDLLGKLVERGGHGNLCETEITPTGVCDCGWTELKKQTEALIDRKPDKDKPKVGG